MTNPDLCGYCRNVIPERSPSDYWCGLGCQELWQQGRSKPLDIWRGGPHLGWDQQGELLSETMTQLREAFTEFGGTVHQVCDALDRLTDVQETS